MGGMAERGEGEAGRTARHSLDPPQPATQGRRNECNAGGREQEQQTRREREYNFRPPPSRQHSTPPLAVDPQTARPRRLPARVSFLHPSFPVTAINRCVPPFSSQPSPPLSPSPPHRPSAPTQPRHATSARSSPSSTRSSRVLLVEGWKCGASLGLRLRRRRERGVVGLFCGL